METREKMGKLNYFRVDSRSCALSHFPDSCKDSRNSWDVILAHFLESVARILCSSFIKSGSFLLGILHLLRRTEVYLWQVKFLVNMIHLYPCFMLYNMFKIPACKYRYIVHRTTRNMNGVGPIFNRYNLGVNIARCQGFYLFSNWENFYRIILNCVYQQFLEFCSGGYS